MREILLPFVAAAQEPCPVTPADNWGLTGPQATVIAALIAVVGAGIAFAGVVKSTGSARYETRRKERFDVLQNGMRAVQDIARAMGHIGMTEQQHRAELVRILNDGPMDEYLAAIAMATSGLLLYGFTDVTNRTGPFVLRLRDLWEEAKRKPTTIVIDTEQIETDAKPVIEAFLSASARLK